MFPGRLEAGFRFWCEWCVEVARRLPGKKLMACDELQKLVDPKQSCWELNLAMETGRRLELDAMVISQQPNLIHNRTRNQMTEVVSFRQVDKNAIDFLQSSGFREEDLQQLKPGHYRVRNLTNGAEASGRVF